MKTLFASLVSLMISVVAHAQSTGIEGNWGIQVSDNGIVFDTTFSIAANSVTVTNVCTVNGSTVTAQITVAAKHDDSTLTILESRQDQKSNGGGECNVSAHMDTMNYSIQGNLLTFSHAGSSQSFALSSK